MTLELKPLDTLLIVTEVTACALVLAMPVIAFSFYLNYLGGNKGVQENKHRGI